MSKRNWLMQKMDELPFWFIIILGILTYFFNQVNAIIAYDTSTPFVECSLKEQPLSTEDDTVFKDICFKLYNLSKEKTIKDLVIEMRYADDYTSQSIIYSPKIKAIAPSNILDKKDYTSNINGTSNKYIIPLFHPRTTYELTAKAIHSSGINPTPKLYIKNVKDNIRLERRTLLTIILRNQLFFNVLLCGVVFFVFILVLIRPLTQNNG